jgi:hypothetical protein
MHIFSIQVDCWPLDLQVSSVAQIFHSLGQISSTVKHLTLQHEADSRLYDEYNEVDHAEWAKLLRSFSNVKTLQVDDGFVDELSRSLQHGGGFSLELLPELQELTYSGSGDTGDLFTSLIDARQSAGRPVTVVRLIPRSVTPFKYSYPSTLESPPIASSQLPSCFRRRFLVHMPVADKCPTHSRWPHSCVWRSRTRVHLAYALPQPSHVPTVRVACHTAGLRSHSPNQESSSTSLLFITSGGNEAGWDLKASILGPGSTSHAL